MHVYIRSGNSWSQQTVLVPSDGLTGCNSFPRPVDISGNTIIFGCPYKMIGGNANQGAVYVFVRIGNAWTEQQRLTASDGATNDRFGEQVRISGEFILVGTPSHDNAPFVNDGSAFVFERTGTTWSQQANLRASDAATNKAFGYRIALGGDTAVISNLPASTTAPRFTIGS